MQAVPDHARQSANVAHMLDNLKGTFYEEFVKRHLRGEASIEAEVFWKALLRTSPAVADETHSKFEQHEQQKQNLSQAKQRAVEQSKLLFSHTLEPLVRSLAADIKYLPCTRGPRLSDKYEGEDAVCDENGFVKGSKRLRLPAALNLSLIHISEPTRPY